ncbi:MAG: T9SS type A sorting domain-containing protein, partial [Bacteroidota bacterium]
VFHAGTVLEQGVVRATEELEAVSAGTYDIFSGTWTVGTVKANSSEQIIFNLYAVENPIDLYAQVTAADQEDIDSSPNNGNGTMALEDDEALRSNAELLHKFVYCPEDVIVTIPRGTGGAVVHYPTPIFQTACSNPYEVVQLRPEGLSSGSFFPVGFTGTLFRAEGEICGEVLCAFNIVVQERDEVVDLELVASTTTPSVSRFERADYTITIRNNSNTDATGVRVQMTMRDMVQVGEFRPTASKGRYIPFYRLWEIGDLAAGEEQTLEIALFTLSDEAQALVQVISADQADTDSMPSSEECCEANEDDEVLLNSDENNLPIISPNIATASTLSDAIFPNPSSAIINVQFEALANNLHWEIVDLQGRIQTAGVWSTNKGLNKRQIEVSELATGMYFLQLPMEDGVRNLRFVKN